MKSPIQSAPELRLLINGKVAGYATGLNYRILQGQKLIFGVDSPFPQEIAQGAGPSYAEGSIQVFRTKDGSPEIWGMMTPRTSEDGVFESGSIASTALGSGKYLVLELRERATDKIVLKMTHVMFGSQEWSVTAKQVMTGSVSFQGIVAHNSDDGTTPNISNIKLPL